MKLLCELNQEDYLSLIEYHTLRYESLIKAIMNATIILENATNGDVIKAMFPTYDVEIEGEYVTCWINENDWIGFNLDWWNAPYKKGGEDGNKNT